jgi:hypothetical protein
MNVLITYLVRNETESRVLELLPEAYFEPLDDLDVSWRIDDVPKHQDAFEYTGYLAENLCWTVLEIRDGNSLRRVRTQFLDGISSMMTHLVDPDGSEEIIHQTEVCAGCWHTIRTSRQAGKAWTVVMNEVTAVGSNRLLRDRGYCGRWSFEAMQEFGNL